MSIINKIVSYFRRKLSVYRYKKRWRQNNPHNETAAGTDINGIVTVGRHTYGVVNAPYACGKIKIGSFCSIADNVSFLSAGEHYTDHLSTFPFDTHIMRHCERGGVTKGDIIVDDDVWIGYNVIILSGVTIGQGAIIGAGSVVAKDVPPYAIYAGHRIIRYRFEPEMVEKLKRFDYSKLSDDEVKNNIDLLYSKISNEFFESDFYKRHLK